MTFPGLHEQVERNLANGYYSSEEEKIIRIFSREWYVTKIGHMSVGMKSNYKYALIKPITNYQEMFNFERELVIIFSDYSDFESRTIDSFDEIINYLPAKRIDKVCGVVISKDPDVERKVLNLINQNEESRVIIPFSYSAVIENQADSFYLRNHFRKFFYERDLFAVESPLKTDLYFFGTTNMIHNIVNRHQKYENSGLFGMRKSGKTSTVYGVQRVLRAKNEVSIFIDCQNPAFHKRRWNKALWYIIEEATSQMNVNITNRSVEEKYTETDAGIFFEKDLKEIYQKIGKKNILFIFDEIENITFV